ncbi:MULTISPECIES: sodium:solute symporter family protein [Dethiosulfovibrio]|uniref:Sodium:solute symporter family protein n=2 Tax=Dethiosulfovibrio TaxID=47054 RepID=A0ABS9EQJ6_9BACT|nr:MULTISPECIES: sodium:solute symporter family protein [Dethiosulfovibrio]MCF4115084.1 sodium:solute symporter family protein [Dethiosulfovibrio russensis]MCF4143474.1 sodium:solute symporter family protein [Dethiosulfovibrio marinus]MCF4145711.1 sodium:solute symporter family protein [Dethiosulfovibrio acidaminovorans]
MFYLGLAAIVTLFLALGFNASRKVSSSSDYAVAGRSTGAIGVGGIIMGAMVGGASTVGTVQMAYSLGLSAWWFTLGAGTGCLILGLWFAGPLRGSGLVTVPEFLAGKYGRKMSGLSMAASSAGTFLSIVAQFLAGTALFRSLLPISVPASTALLAVLILGFIYAGGLKSYSSVGSAKMVALYVTMVLGAIAALTKLSSPTEIFRTLPATPWFDLFGRGFRSDGNALLSLIAGVFCTQIYIQGVFAASDEKTARKGALMAAFFIPPVGLMGVSIGLAMRASGTVVEPAMALPAFLLASFPDALAGVLWGALVITVVGAGAGLSFGIATNLVRDLIIPGVGSSAANRELSLSRWAVALVVCVAAATGCMVEGSLILQWSYLSMGLRGAGTFVPLMIAMIWPDRLSPRWALAANGGGLATMIASGVMHTSVPPMASGLAVSAAVALFGMTRKRT